MTDSNAEQLDPSVLGEEVGDAGRPGDDFPPDEPLAVEDPAITVDGMIARDDVAQRERRRATDAAGRPDAPGLVDPDTTEVPGVDDRERQAIATEATPEPGPEAGAVHVDTDR